MKNPLISSPKITEQKSLNFSCNGQRALIQLLRRFPYLLSFLSLLIWCREGFAQIPQDVPHPDEGEPISLDSPTGIVLFIVLPLFFIGLYIFLRRRKKKK